jgi:hypothetical protein
MNCCVKCEIFGILLTYQKIINPQTTLGQRKEIEGEGKRSISETITKQSSDLHSKHNEEI